MSKCIGRIIVFGFRESVLQSVWLLAAVSSILLVFAQPGRAHELQPAIADLTIEGGTLTLDIALNLEALLAGIDLELHDDTTESPEAAEYDALRGEAPDVLAALLNESWGGIAERITLRAGDSDLEPLLAEVDVAEVGDVDLPRESRLRVLAELPNDSSPVVVGWDADLGPIVVRQTGVEAPYTGYLDGGTLSDPIPRAGGVDRSWAATFANYVVIGFEHILPKGLDHILFVLGLFFLSLKLAPLLWQISAFTIAHTITLALGILGVVTVPAAIVEPLIAASIVYVGIENVFSKGLTPWRPVVVFCFGLLHGLGFASVLGDIGLDSATFITGLIGFNVGVELGQLTVIAIAFLTVGLWFGQKPWYKARIANPASVAIALIGTWWVIERTLL